MSFLDADARRLARQLATLARTHPRPTAITAAVWVASLAAAAVASAPPAAAASIAAALAAWVLSMPTRHWKRLRWRRAAKDAGLDHPPHLTPFTVTRRPYGWGATVTLKAGHSCEDLASRVPRLRASLAVRDVLVEPVDREKGHALVDVVERLPWTPGELVAWPHADAERLSVWEPIPVAVDMHLQPVAWHLCQPGVGATNVLAGGIPRSGKSTNIHLYAATAALDPDCTLVICDGKKAELWAWRDAAARYVGPDMGEAIAALRWLNNWVDRRLDVLADRGTRVAEPGDPTVMFICDEWATYSDDLDRDAAHEYDRLAKRATQRGAAVGLIGVYGTQKPSADVIPTSVRDLLANRVGFRATTPEASDMTLGKGMAARGYNAMGVPADQRGVGWFTSLGETPRMCKSYALTDEQLHALAARAPAPQRPPQPKPRVPSTPPAAAANGHDPDGNGEAVEFTLP